MNSNHDYCGSEDWQETVRDLIIPWSLADGDLGDDVLEVGPGFGATTEVFRHRVGTLTAVEIDHALAQRLRSRFADTNVVVVEGDATALTFDADRFSGATSFAMLHHVPTAEMQDRLFAEVARVVRPGGLFVASDSLASDGLAEYHEGDTYNPVDPDGVAGRLVRCGFTDVEVRTNEFGWAATARATATAAA